MSANPNQPTLAKQSRDILKTGISLPVVGIVSLPVLVIGGFLLYKMLKRKRVTSVTTRFGK